jgi:hypothetical protein
MRTRISRTLGATAGCFLIALLVACYFLSPFVFLWSLASAANDADRDTLSAAIDFPAVREGLDEQLDAVLARRAERHTSHRQSGLDRAINGFLPALGHQLVNNILTPDGVAALLRQHVKKAGDGSGRPSLWRGQISFLSSNRLVVTYADARHPELPFSVELERQRIFGWRVTRLNLPLQEIGELIP